MQDRVTVRRGESVQRGDLILLTGRGPRGRDQQGRVAAIAGGFISAVDQKTGCRFIAEPGQVFKVRTAQGATTW